MSTEIKIARVYLREGDASFKELIHLLKEVEKVRGFTLFRGFDGMGASGQAGHLADLSLQMPTVVEFFDHPDRVDAIIEACKGIVKANHVISWFGEMS